MINAGCGTAKNDVFDALYCINMEKIVIDQNRKGLYTALQKVPQHNTAQHSTTKHSTERARIEIERKQQWRTLNKLKSFLDTISRALSLNPWVSLSTALSRNIMSCHIR